MLDIASVLEGIRGLPESERLVVLKDLEALHEKQAILDSQNHFLPFVKLMWPSFIGGRHHEKMADAFERVERGELKRLIINMPPRHCLTLDTPIPTPNGMVKMEDIKVGDMVFGSDGKPTPVIGKSEVHNGRQLYRVTTDDNCSVVTDGGHLWTVRIDRKHGIFNDYTTEQLFERQQGRVLRTLRNGKVAFNNRKVVTAGKVRRPMLPHGGAPEYPSAELPIAPYTLGIWLGDGHKNQAVITSADDDAGHIRERIEAEGYKTSNQSTPMTFGILGLKVKLRDAGLLGNKNIPEAYLTASRDQRMELLRGLMDSDGNVTKSGQCFFAQKSKAMCQSVMQLVRSLGAKAFLESREVAGYGIHHKVSFYLEGCCGLPRKNERTKTPVAGRFLTIEKLDMVGDVQCIEIANADGLFYAGTGYILTHNTKSEFASYLLPAWFLGKHPTKKIIQTSHTGELSVGFGRKVRNLIQGGDFQNVFSGIDLSVDSKAAGRWNTNKGGEYFAVGTGGAVTGKGADLLIIDDPVSEQDAAHGAYDPKVYDKVYEWYTSGPRQRLQPGGAIIIVMTRWSKRDLAGQVIQKAAEREGSDQWEVIEFPAILPSGKSLWPEFWSIEELSAIKSEISVSKWNAQYQQNPTSEEGAIIKREWWKEWPSVTPPPVEGIIQSWDTAFLKTQRSDYSACTTWGIFHHESEDGIRVPNLILLDAYKEKLEFPELKREAHRKYWEFEPDQLVVEKKASGAPLIAELRMMGIPVTEFTPVRGNDKIARANAVADLFASGVVWYPPRKWADDVIEECASFPSGDHDDYVDSCLVGETLVLMADGTEKRIDMVRVGDLVKTPTGSKRVIRFLDQGVKEVWKVETGASHILATADHLVMTDRGWMQVDSLSPFVDTVTQSTRRDMLWRSKALALPRKLLSSMVGATSDTLRATIRPTEDISLAQATAFTGMFGSFTTAQSQMAMRFTTSMETPETTTSRTLNALREECTGIYTSRACLSVLNNQPILSILRLYARLRRRGTLRKRARLGIESMRKVHLLPLAQLLPRKAFLKSLSYVLGAALSMWGKASGASFAAVPVKTQKAGSGLVRAAQNTHTMRRVYDLEVEGEHCFYANGILVHNCTQALIRFRQGGWLRTSLDDIDDDPIYQPPVEYY